MNTIHTCLECGGKFICMDTNRDNCSDYENPDSECLCEACNGGCHTIPPKVSRAKRVGKLIGGHAVQ
jgi:hypothetical protein